MKILTIDENEKFLRTKSKKLSKDQLKNKKIQTLIKDMRTELKENQGDAGLSAVQVGHLYRIFAVKLYHKDKNNPPIETFINPQLDYLGQMKEIKKEGCLSIPDVSEKVSRFRRVKIKYLDATGNKQKKKFSGFVARIIQHEYDHLEGVLFIDKIAE